MTDIPKIKLNSGALIPQIGLGLWKLTDEQQFNEAFTAAINAGYRHFDTAQAYHNEQLLGAAIKNCSIKREELFITTKIAVQNFGDKKSRHSFDESLKKLGTDYVDLLLLHFPVPLLRKKTWKIAETIKQQSLARSIGVSNFTINHLNQLQQYCEQLPSVNQVEMHIFLQQHELKEYCDQKGIVIEAYSPLAHAKDMDNDTILQLATKYHKSYAQVMLSWAQQQGVVIIPKSASPNRIAENIDIFDFKLNSNDLRLLSQQNRNLRTCWNPELVP